MPKEEKKAPQKVTKDGHLELIKIKMAKLSKEQRRTQAQKAIAGAIKNGKLDVARYLLTQGATLEELARNFAKKHKGGTLLISAVLDESVELVEFMLEHGQEINAVDAEGWPALQHAVLRGNDEIVRHLLLKGANPNLVDEVGNICLSFAIVHKHITCLNLLLTGGVDEQKEQQKNARNKADVNLCSGTYRDSPLQFAASRSWDECAAEIVGLLIEHGADVNQANSKGVTPLMLGHYNSLVTEKLLAANAQLDQKDENNRTAVLWAAANRPPKSYAAIKVLVKADPKCINDEDDSGDTLFSLLKANSTQEYQVEYQSLLADISMIITPTTSRLKK